MIRILAIGNSFSQDATAHLQAIARSAGVHLFVRNLFIGGCSLERHWQNAESGEASYEYQEDGNLLRMISLDQALAEEPWDWITLQQVSHHSGLPDTYEPYLGNLIRHVNGKAPQARLAFHETWAYEFDSEHGGFPLYQNDCRLMAEKVQSTAKAMAEKYGLPEIRVGSAIERLRSHPEFDPQRGGIRLTRDGFHLSFDLGRYAAGLVWFAFFAPKSADRPVFIPEGSDPKWAAEIRRILLPRG